MFSVSSHAGEFYLELGVGKNDIFGENDWIGRESTACMFGAGWATRKDQWQYDFTFRHHSQCTRGEGFDSRDEDTLDSIGLFIRYYL
jgi:hypothetical protein